MSTVVAPNAGISITAWSAEMHDTVSIASHSYSQASQLSSTMNQRFKRVQLAWDVRQLSARLSHFLDLIYESLRKAESGSVSTTKPASREDIQQAQLSLEYLHAITSRLYQTAVQKGLLNSSLMAGSLSCIHKRAEELLDLADWMQIALTSKPSRLEALYSRARADLAEGEVFRLADVE